MMTITKKNSDINRMVKELIAQEQKQCRDRMAKLKDQFEDFQHEMQKMELRLVIKMGSLLTLSAGIIISYLDK